MARSRNLKPGFFRNETLAECSLAARLCFAGLWTLADREGRLEDRPRRIKADLFPFDDLDVEPLLEELNDRGFIRRYSVDGAGYVAVINFARHQNPHHREQASTFPPPPIDDSRTADGDKPEASPGLARDKPEASPEQAVLIPSSLIPSSEAKASIAPDPVQDRSPARRQSKRTTAGSDAPTAETWTSYEDAYVARYRVKPLRGQKVNAQIKRMVEAVGAAKAPEIARFYLAQTGPLYMASKHPVDLLLRDVQKLHTEWASANGGGDNGRPQWALGAGFTNRYEAENAGCNERNAAAFRNGRRLEVAA